MSGTHTSTLHPGGIFTSILIVSSKISHSTSAVPLGVGTEPFAHFSPQGSGAIRISSNPAFTGFTPSIPFKNSKPGLHDQA
jgi:hypothetical protein